MYCHVHLHNSSNHHGFPSLKVVPIWISQLPQGNHRPLSHGGQFAASCPWSCKGRTMSEVYWKVFLLILKVCNHYGSCFRTTNSHQFCDHGVDSKVALHLGHHTSTNCIATAMTSTATWPQPFHGWLLKVPVTSPFTLTAILREGFMGVIPNSTIIP